MSSDDPVLFIIRGVDPDTISPPIHRGILQNITRWQNRHVPVLGSTPTCLRFFVGEVQEPPKSARTRGVRSYTVPRSDGHVSAAEVEIAGILQAHRVHGLPFPVPCVIDAPPCQVEVLVQSLRSSIKGLRSQSYTLEGVAIVSCWR